MNCFIKYGQGTSVHCGRRHGKPPGGAKYAGYKRPHAKARSGKRKKKDITQRREAERA